ncbi:hypothetical protein [Anaerosolibacter sp.]|uniref:hypothetical protein n=1 Tax=Anaerosolibacter sp. TaxID=1872527 RepID=UPI0039EFDE24
MDEVKFKSDKHCVECRIQTRKDIISEIKEACNGCTKLNKLEQEKKPQVLHKKHGRWRR